MAGEGSPRSKLLLFLEKEGKADNGAVNQQTADD